MEQRGAFDRQGVGERGIRSCALADPDGPVLGDPLRLTPRLGGLEQVAVHLFLAEVVDGQPPALVEEQRLVRVDDRLAFEERANPIGHRVEVEHEVRRFELEVEAPSRLAGEGAVIGSQ
ncbi:MAG TPA: hypothetical protein VES61_08590 [Gaiellaceae bacterium]|nr:hypothetical protein [Gaiellaceae bacterium]